jgi:hypothetical protein
MVKRVQPATGPEADDLVELDNETGVQAGDDLVDETADPADVLPKRARRNVDGTVTLTLEYPQTLRVSQRGGEAIREERYTELVFHRMNGADLAAIAAASKESQLKVSVMRSLRLNQAVVAKLFDKLDAADASAACEVAGFFLGSGGRTGR